MPKKSKDPAFLFYPSDWIGGTMGMSFEEKGMYIELLMMQFSRGHMTPHMIGQVVGQNWDKISHKFTQDENGLWYNERLELEKKRRKAFTDSRKNNLKGSNQHSNKSGHMGGQVTNHMVNENVNTNTGSVEGGAGGRMKPPEEKECITYLEEKFCDNLTRSEIEKIPSQFIDYYDSVGWIVGRNRKPMQNWKTALNNWVRNIIEKNEKGRKIGRNTEESLRRTLDTDF